MNSLYRQTFLKTDAVFFVKKMPLVGVLFEGLFACPVEDVLVGELLRDDLESEVDVLGLVEIDVLLGLIHLYEGVCCPLPPEQDIAKVGPGEEGTKVDVYLFIKLVEEDAEGLLCHADDGQGCLHVSEQGVMLYVVAKEPCVEGEAQGLYVVAHLIVYVVGEVEPELVSVAEGLLKGFVEPFVSKERFLD